MKLGSELEALLSTEASRPDQGATVWLVESRLFRSREVLKARILGAFLGSGVPLFIWHDDPAGEGVPGDWLSAGDGWWRVPRDFRPEEASTDYWLRLGNWTLSAGAPLLPRVDLFRSAPFEVLDYLARAAAFGVIDSFHDNNPWVVALSSRRSGLSGEA